MVVRPFGFIVGRCWGRARQESRDVEVRKLGRWAGVGFDGRSPERQCHPRRIRRRGVYRDSQQDAVDDVALGPRGESLGSDVLFPPSHAPLIVFRLHGVGDQDRPSRRSGMSAQLKYEHVLFEVGAGEGSGAVRPVERIVEQPESGFASLAHTDVDGR